MMFLWTFWYIICNFLNWNEQDMNLQSFYYFLKFLINSRTFRTGTTPNRWDWPVGPKSTPAATWSWLGQNGWPAGAHRRWDRTTMAMMLEDSPGHASKCVGRGVMCEAKFGRRSCQMVTGAIPVNLTTAAPDGLRRQWAREHATT
jgi:hypothetical protein